MIRRMKGVKHDLDGVHGGVPIRRRDPTDHGLERCVHVDCVFGPIEKRPELAVVRFTPGFVQRLKWGNFFKSCLKFEDDKRHKFAHYECCYDAGLRMEDLSMDRCTLGCNGDYACWRNADETDAEGLYKPNKRPEWGCEPSGCILVEHGYFESTKSGLYLRFIPKQGAAVHWACAKAVWDWELLTGMTKTFEGTLKCPSQEG